MKRIWITLMIVGFFTGTINSFAQDYQKAEKAEISKKAEPISFDKTTHSFGDLVKGSPATASFTIKNNKTEPIIIEELIPIFEFVLSLGVLFLQK